MAKTSFLLAAMAALLAAGCSSENNSPDMGAVPPKPNPDVIKNMPPQVQDQMKNAESGMKQQVQEMGDASKSGK